MQYPQRFAPTCPSLFAFVLLAACDGGRLEISGDPAGGDPACANSACDDGAVSRPPPGEGGVTLAEDLDAGGPPLVGDAGPSVDAAGPVVPDAGPPRDVPGFTECEGPGEAHNVFNAFWQQFDRNYAVFDARLPGETWRAVASDACADIRDGMPDGELFDVILGMLQKLDDGHTWIEANNIGRYGDSMVSDYDYYGEMDDAVDLVENEYIDGALSRGAGGEIRWGRIGEFGYIFVESMGVGEGAIDNAMSQAMNDLGDRQGMVVDVRNNGGGYDSSALAVARWFKGPRTVAWREQERNGPDYVDLTAPRDVYVEASPANGFNGPVVVLQSKVTFSAAETFGLAMQVRDQVTFVGEQTFGHLSDIFDCDRLPNGWQCYYSGERYTAADGSYYEGTGIPVDVAAPVDPQAFRAGQDNMLEAALEVLRAAQ